MNGLRILCLCLVVGCAAVGTTGGVGFTSPDETRSLLVDGRRRTYRIHVPSGIDRRSPRPLVIVLHGHGGTAKRIMRVSGMNAVADQGGFIVAYPEGTSWLGIPWRSWNAGNCCGYAMGRGVDDVQFIRVLIDTLSHSHPIDSSRVYVTGVSNGGMMAHRLGCELSDRLAAIGVVAGALGYDACDPSQALSVVILHGTDDQYVLYEGGASPKSGDHRIDKPVAEAVSLWVERNGCSRVPEADERGTLTRERYTGGINETEVLLYTIQHGRHVWPSRDESATTLLWEFFSRHTNVLSPS